MDLNLNEEIKIIGCRVFTTFLLVAMGNHGSLSQSFSSISNGVDYPDNIIQNRLDPKYIRENSANRRTGCRNPYGASHQSQSAGRNGAGPRRFRSGWLGADCA